METNYCPLCGYENTPQVEICAKCSVDLTTTNAYRPLTPIQKKPLLIVLVASVLFLLATHFVEALEFFAFQWQSRDTITSGTLMLVSLDSLAELIWPALVFFVAGIGLSLLAGRKTPREGLILGAALAGVQLLVWIWAANFQAGLLVSGAIQISRVGVLMALPSVLLVVVGLAAIFAGPVAGTAIGGALAERKAGKSHCVYCDANLSINPLPLACKACHAPVPQPKIRWGIAWLGVALTALLFSLFLSFAGPSLGFFYRCGFTDTSETCTEAKKSYGEGLKQGVSNPWVRITDNRGAEKGDGYFILYHSWNYTLYLAIPFFIAPFLLAYSLRKSALATAGISIPFAWIVCTLLALLYFDLGSFEGSFLYSLRFHIMAFFVWAFAGSIGAMMGHHFGYSPAKAMMEIQ